MKTYDSENRTVRLAPCTYGLSRLSFRGPRRPTDGRYIAFLGGSDTFARYVPKPYCDLVAAATGEICVNLGCQSAGADVYLKDTALQTLRRDASATVIQVFGAANLSNPYYRVHPRRNDRFIAATPKLIALYPEVDFSEISFTGHLIARLRAVDEARFALVRTCLQATWVIRMHTLIADAASPVLLLWFASRAPDDKIHDTPAGDDPAFITLEMLDMLRDAADDIIEVIMPRGETEGMAFPPLDSLSAQNSLGVDAHFAAAKALRLPLTFGLS